MPSIDEKIDQIAKGREAAIVAGLLRPVIEDKIETVLRNLIAQYRALTASHDFLVGAVAEISALRGLIDDLERIHKKGIRALDTEHKNAAS